MAEHGVGHPGKMLETFLEFTFDAAHQTPPFSGMHGHTFRSRVYLRGKPDPVFGWSHNLYEVEPTIAGLRQELDHKYLNDIEGLAVPTLENLTRWIWERLTQSINGVDRVEVSRGFGGHEEGCICYSEGRSTGDERLVDGGSRA
jgi:6-pyruvoyltetrahydropterin/6-carboxytetrahydropterin synthase